MDSHMHCSSWFLSEFSIANFTSKRLFTSMNSFVTFQNWWAPKWFLTNITIIFASEIIGRLTFSSRHFRNVFNDQYLRSVLLFSSIYYFYFYRDFSWKRQSEGRHGLWWKLSRYQVVVNDSLGQGRERDGRLRRFCMLLYIAGIQAFHIFSWTDKTPPFLVRCQNLMILYNRI